MFTFFNSVKGRSLSNTIIFSTLLYVIILFQSGNSSHFSRYETTSVFLLHVNYFYLTYRIPYYLNLIFTLPNPSDTKSNLLLIVRIQILPPHHLPLKGYYTLPIKCLINSPVEQLTTLSILTLYFHKPETLQMDL